MEFQARYEEERRQLVDQAGVIAGGDWVLEERLKRLVQDAYDKGLDLGQDIARSV